MNTSHDSPDASSSNPYEPPKDVMSGLPPGGDSTACRYGDLPRSCPQCSRKFSEVLYKKLYPRRLRPGTLIYFAVVGMISLVALLILKTLFWDFLIFITGPLVTAGLRAKRSTRVYCKECGWSRKYLVTSHS